MVELVHAGRSPDELTREFERPYWERGALLRKPTALMGAPRSLKNSRWWMRRALPVVAGRLSDLNGDRRAGRRLAIIASLSRW
jgi:hypothetical protein